MRGAWRHAAHGGQPSRRRLLRSTGLPRERRIYAAVLLSRPSGRGSGLDARATGVVGARDVLRGLAIGVLVGLVCGVGTSIGQTMLPEPVLQLANSAAVWLLASYLAGWWAASVTWAAVGGVLALVAADVAFYVGMYAQFGIIGSWTGDLYYLVGAIVAGPVLGAAGLVTRRRPRLAAAAVATLAAVFFAEAAFRADTFAGNSQFAAAWPIFAVLGAAVIVATLPWTRAHPWGLLAVVPFALLSYVGLRYVLPAMLGWL